VPPCGCSVALHSLSCFSLPCFRSLQPTLYCNKASLITATLHFRASLRSTSLHFISPPFLSAFCSPPAALFGSPAGRYGLRLNLFNCLHFVLAIKAVASCSALQAVMVLAEKKQQPRQPSASTCAVHRLRTSGLLSTTLAQLAVASRVQAVGRKKKLHPMACPFSSWLL